MGNFKVLDEDIKDTAPKVFGGRGGALGRAWGGEVIRKGGEGRYEIWGSGRGSRCQIKT